MTVQDPKKLQAFVECVWFSSYQDVKVEARSEVGTAMFKPTMLTLVNRSCSTVVAA